MYYKDPVKIPSIKGRISRQTTKSGTYIHYVLERVYDNQKKFTVPKRVLIGRLHDDDNDLMLPNERFFELFPSTPRKLRDAAVRCANIQIGPYIVIEKVLQESGLDKLLHKHFGKDAGFLADWISYMIVESRNQGQHYPDYAYTHPLFTTGMRPLSDASISEFFSNVTVDQIRGFLDDWNEKQDHTQRIYISYDSTNKNCQAGDVDLLEFGKAKVDIGERFFNIAVAFDALNKVPLFYEQYPGSINDVSQLQYVVEKAWNFNYRKIGFIIDRGYFSRANIEYMDEHGYQFIMMVKGCKPLVSGLIDEFKGRFEDAPSHVLTNSRLSGITTERQLFPGDEKKRFFHLYFNPYKHAQQWEELNRQVCRMNQEIAKAVGTKLVLAPEYEEFFELLYDKNGTLLHAVVRDQAIGAMMRRLGYFCIVTSEKMTAQEAYDLYTGRDVSEKLFAATKTFLGGKSMRVHSEESLTAKVFAEFVALVVRNRIYNLLKNEMLKLPVRENYMTVPAAIKELEKFAVVRINRTTYQMDYGITKTQRIILRAFGISAQQAEMRAAELAAALAKSDKALLAKAAKEEPESTEDEGFEGALWAK